MDLIHLFIDKSKIKEVHNNLCYTTKPFINNVIKLYRIDNMIFYNTKYYTIIKESNWISKLGIFRHMKLKEINPILFPSKKDYYIETFEGTKKYTGVNTYIIQNKTQSILISTDLHELNTILQNQLS